MASIRFLLALCLLMPAFTYAGEVPSVSKDDKIKELENVIKSLQKKISEEVKKTEACEEREEKLKNDYEKLKQDYEESEDRNQDVIKRMARTVKAAEERGAEGLVEEIKEQKELITQMKNELKECKGGKQPTCGNTNEEKKEPPKVELYSAGESGSQCKKSDDKAQEELVQCQKQLREITKKQKEISDQSSIVQMNHMTLQNHLRTCREDMREKNERLEFWPSALATQLMVQMTISRGRTAAEKAESDCKAKMDKLEAGCMEKCEGVTTAEDYITELEAAREVARDKTETLVLCDNANIKLKRNVDSCQEDWAKMNEEVKTVRENYQEKCEFLDYCVDKECPGSEACQKQLQDMEETHKQVTSDLAEASDKHTNCDETLKVVREKGNSAANELKELSKVFKEMNESCTTCKAELEDTSSMKQFVEWKISGMEMVINKLEDAKKDALAKVDKVMEKAGDELFWRKSFYLTLLVLAMICCYHLAMLLHTLWVERNKALAKQTKEAKEEAREKKGGKKKKVPTATLR